MNHLNYRIASCAKNAQPLSHARRTHTMRFRCYSQVFWFMCAHYVVLEREATLSHVRSGAASLIYRPFILHENSTSRAEFRCVSNKTTDSNRFFMIQPIQLMRNQHQIWLVNNFISVGIYFVSPQQYLSSNCDCQIQARRKIPQCNFCTHAQTCTVCYEMGCKIMGCEHSSSVSVVDVDFYYFSRKKLWQMKM